MSEELDVAIDKCGDETLLVPLGHRFVCATRGIIVGCCIIAVGLPVNQVARLKLMHLIGHAWLTSKAFCVLAEGAVHDVAADLLLTALEIIVCPIFDNVIH